MLYKLPEDQLALQVSQRAERLCDKNVENHRVQTHVPRKLLKMYYGVSVLQQCRHIYCKTQKCNPVNAKLKGDANNTVQLYDCHQHGGCVFGW